MAFLLVAVPCTGCTQMCPADPPALPASALTRRQPKWRIRSSSLARRFMLLASFGAAAWSPSAAGCCCEEEEEEEGWALGWAAAGPLWSMIPMGAHSR